MNDIVQTVTPETLFAASYQHCEAYALHCARMSTGELLDTPQLIWGISGVTSPWMNSVVRTRLDPGADVDALVESMLTRARQRSVPLGWFLAPGTTPANMGETLIAHGFAYEDDEPGMAVDLHHLPDRVPTPANLRIVEVLDRPTLRQWVDTWGESYGADDAKRQGRFDFRAGQPLDSRSSYRPFLAYLDDQPIATAELFLGAGVAAVVWVGTIPAARRQGIGAAITLAPLLAARQLGYRIGTLTSSTKGYTVYQGLGFREYSRRPVYVWRPGT